MTTSIGDDPEFSRLLGAHINRVFDGLTSVASRAELVAHITKFFTGQPLAYAVYGIGAGKHYIRDVKLIPATDTREAWKSDDDGLGEYWAGNIALVPAEFGRPPAWRHAKGGADANSPPVK